MTTAAHFEALNYALRKSKDGVIVSFLVQPDDVTRDLLSLPVGARVMVAWSAISDDEKPVASVSPTTHDSSERSPPSEPPQAQESGGAAFQRSHSGENGAASDPAPAAAPRPKRKFSELSLPEQAGIRCEDARFQAFLRINGWTIANDAHGAAEAVRAVCDVPSRTDLADEIAGKKWRKIEDAFQQYLTDARYADARR